MVKKILKKKRGRPKKVKVPKTEKEEMTFSSTTPIEMSEPTETKSLPIIDGSQALEVVGENETATHYKLANGTTTWVPKK